MSGEKDLELAKKKAAAAAKAKAAALAKMKAGKKDSQPPSERSTDPIEIEVELAQQKAEALAEAKNAPQGFEPEAGKEETGNDLPLPNPAHLELELAKQKAAAAARAKAEPLADNQGGRTASEPLLEIERFNEFSKPLPNQSFADMELAKQKASAAARAKAAAMAQEMAAAQTVSLSRESQQDTNKNPASLPTTSAHTEFDLEARKAIKAKAAELAAKSSTFYLEDDNTKALATEKETASAELKSKRAAMASSAAEHPEQKSEPIMSKKAAEEFSQLSEEDEKAKAAALAKQGGEAPEGDEKAKAIAVAKAKAAAAAKAKAAALAKQGGEAPEGDEKAKAIAAAKAKAAAAAKAKAAALAKQGGEAPEGDEKAKAIAAAKAKAAAAAKAKAAALVKQDGEAPEGDEKAKAIAAAKAKAAAAAKAKAAGAGKARPAVEPPADSKPSPNQKFLDKYIKVIEENLGTDILAAAYINPLSKDVPTLEVKVSAYYRTAEFLKYNEQLAFDYLSELHGTDFGSHFEVYVHLYSYRNSQSAAVKVRVDRENPVLPSLVPLWQGANWPESEAYDLLGIQFSNHPDLKRIMLGEGWIGHPLRKDYEPYDVEV